MSLKAKSLGSASAAARGIVMSAITTGVPASITLTAGHRLKNGDRIAIAGNNTTDLGTFGEWSVSGLSATSAVLDGSSASGALSGTPVIAVLCDRTPFLPRHAAVAAISAGVGAAATDGIATVVLEGADSMISTGFQYTNSSGVATSGFKDATKSGEIAMAFNDFGGVFVEVDLMKYMTMRLSAWTSGTFGATLLSQRVLPGRLAISFEGLRHLIADLHKQGIRPAAILVSPHEKRDLKQELMAASKQHSKDAEEADHDLRAIGFIGGIPIMSHKDVPRGQARIMKKADLADRNRDLIVK